MRALILGRLVDWLGEIRVMRLGATLLMLGIFLIAIPDSLILLAVFWALVPIGTACLFPSTSASVTHRISEHEFGQTLGVQQAFGGIARVAGPIWATAVYQGLGEKVPFVIAAGIISVAVVLTFMVKAPAEPVTPEEVRQEEPVPLKAR